jgi:Holliday junction resolvasome RuvABC endonuclease subunit
MVAVGLDPSTWFGMAYLPDDWSEAKGKCIHFEHMKGQRRVRAIADELINTLQAWNPDRVLIEGYGFANKSSLVGLVEIGTVARQALLRMHIDWYEAPPTVIKKWTTGSGKAEKAEMLQASKAKWGYSSPSDDIVDAMAMAHMAALPMEELLKIKGVVQGY